MNTTVITVGYLIFSIRNPGNKPQQAHKQTLGTDCLKNIETILSGGYNQPRYL